MPQCKTSEKSLRELQSVPHGTGLGMREEKVWAGNSGAYPLGVRCCRATGNYCARHQRRTRTCRERRLGWPTRSSCAEARQGKLRCARGHNQPDDVVLQTLVLYPVFRLLPSTRAAALGSDAAHAPYQLALEPLLSAGGVLRTDDARLHLCTARLPAGERG